MTDILKVFFTISTYFIAGGLFLALSAYIVSRTYPGNNNKPLTVTRNHNKIQYIPHTHTHRQRRAA